MGGLYVQNSKHQVVLMGLYCAFLLLRLHRKVNLVKVLVSMKKITDNKITGMSVNEGTQLVCQASHPQSAPKNFPTAAAAPQKWLVRTGLKGC